MSFFSLKHSKLAYCADFVFYGTAVAVLSVAVVFASPHGRGMASAAGVLLALLGWSLIEYLLHRFVLHGLPPFSGWHAQHHRHPVALVITPTVLSAALFAVLVALPALALGGMWALSTVSLGMLAGYLIYAVAHHASHHWRAESAWTKWLKHWHAMHHRMAPDGCCYGVTSPLWDHVFATARPRRASSSTPASRPASTSTSAQASAKRAIARSTGRD